jgi:hypothetical protein
MLASFMVAAEPRYACSPAVAPGEVVTRLIELLEDRK